MLIKRSWLLIGMVLILLIGAGLGINSCTIIKSGEPMLTEYPGAFKKDTLIVVGENASPIESEAAEAIAADLEESKGSVPVIKSDAEVTEEDKGNHNLILIGIKGSNRVLTEVWEKSEATVITDENPGANKGVIEILANLWNSEMVVLIIAGSDEGGVRAGNAILKYVYGLDKAKVVVDWEHLKENERAVDMGLTPREFRILDKEVHEYFSEYFPGAEYPIVYTRLEKLENEPGLIVIEATAGVILPSPSATFGFRGGKVFVISGISWED